MLASNIRALLRPMRIMLGVLAVFVLVQIVLRVFRRAAPEPMPWRLAPMLTTRWRSRLFGAPERVLDRAGAAAGMHVLEVGPGPGNVHRAPSPTGRLLGRGRPSYLPRDPTADD
jgi:hypothetical protein